MEKRSENSTKTNTGQLGAYVELAVMLGLAVVVVRLTWIGYQAYADDIMTIRGALLWGQDFPYLGTTHWELRHPFVLVLAASIQVMGLSELSVILPNCIIFLLLIILTWFAFLRWRSSIVAVIAMAMMLFTPIFVFGASTMFPDLMELLLVIASVLLFNIALESPTSRAVYLVTSGLLAGLAFATRETAAALIVFYAILFLSGFGMPRQKYFLMALGFLIPVLADIAFVSTLTNDILYRYRIDLAQVHPWEEISAFDFLRPEPSSSLLAAQQPLETERLLKVARSVQAVGPVDINPLINPYIALWTNHEYGAIFYLVLGAVIYLFSKRQRSQVPRFIKLVCALGLCWFIVLTYVLSVLPIPRYFLPVTFAALMLNATWIGSLIERQRYLFATLLLLTSFAGGLLAYDLHSERLHEERVLVAVADYYREPVHTHSSIAVDARFLMQTRGLEQLAKTDKPLPGGLVLDSSAHQQIYSDKSDWTELERHEPRQRVLGWLLEGLGMLDRLPLNIANKVNRPSPTIVLYRTPPA